MRENKPQSHQAPGPQGQAQGHTAAGAFPEDGEQKAGTQTVSHEEELWEGGFPEESLGWAEHNGSL